MAYMYLAIAIFCEVIGTMLLPLSKNFTKPLPSIVIVFAYTMAFYFLALSIKSIPIAIAYATWAGLGIFLISILSYFIYGQALQWQSIAGLIMIIIGVIIVHVFATNSID